MESTVDMPHPSLRVVGSEGGLVQVSRGYDPSTIGLLIDQGGQTQAIVLGKNEASQGTDLLSVTLDNRSTL